MEPFHLTVYGKPEPGGSKIANRFGGVRDANKKVAPWRDKVADKAGEKMVEEGRKLMTGPLAVVVVFYLQRPQGHYGTGKNAGLVKASAPLYPTVKPDATKLWRAVEDALTGVVYRDDASIVAQEVHKRYGTPVRVELVVREITDQSPATFIDPLYGWKKVEEVAAA